MFRNLPAQANLEYLRKEAKKLLREYRSAASEAVALFQGVVAPGDKPRLADAQFIISRKYGFENWAALKHHVALAAADFNKRADAMISAAFSGRLKDARELLESEPALATANIHAAVTTGQHDHVERLLSDDPSLATASGGPNNHPAIIYACFSRFLKDQLLAAGIVRSVELLLKYGADPNAYFLEGDDPNARQTPLYGAAGVANNPTLTKLLLDHGADPDDGAPGMGESLYHSAEFFDLRCLKLILEANPRPDTVSYCLAHKLDFEDIDGIKLFLDHGADPNFLFKHAHKGTRLHHAILRRRGPAIIRLLMNYGADWRIPDGDGLTSFAFAVRIGHQAAADVMREFEAGDDDLTPADRLLGAFSRGDRHSVHHIIATRPGIVASLSPKDRTVLPEAAKAGNISGVKLMLEAGFDPEITSQGFKDGMTALHWAAFFGRLDMIELLLTYGANIEALNAWGGTVMYSTVYAASEEDLGIDHLPVIRGLLDAGARIDIGSDGEPRKTGVDAIDQLLRERFEKDED